jgi:Glycosyl transferase family 11
MIITHLLGGLGNQMFQYAAGLALANRHRTVLKLDVSWFRKYIEYEAHNQYGLSCFNITEQFATADEIDRIRGVRLTRIERWSVGLARRAHFSHYAARFGEPSNHHVPPTFRFYPEFWEQPDNTYLEGMFQSEKFFAPVANLLRLHFSFRYPALPSVIEMERRINSGPSAAVHFRRGDFVRNPSFKKDLGVLNQDYYHQAVAQLRQRHPDVVLYIFSDDIDAVEREFQLDGPHVFVRATEPWHSFDKIRLMSRCQHAIIANSTFSWWAAWLNSRPEKVIIAPDPWFASDRYDGADVIPESWQRVATM